MLHELLHPMQDLLSLMYPNLCAACSEQVPPRQEVICLRCQYKLPRTNFHQEKDNPFTERFWGRVPLESGAALYHFVKGGRVQDLIHRLKYEGRRDIGTQLGKLYGTQLRESPWFKGVELIVPVPLHPAKEHRRGYNQSALIAAGLSETMGVPWLRQGLIRAAFTETQTRKSRTERIANVARVFQIGNAAKLRGKHILLVDDVMTTGATLEACAEAILELPGTRLSMATLAIADA